MLFHVLGFVRTRKGIIGKRNDKIALIPSNEFVYQNMLNLTVQAWGDCIAEFC